MKSNRVAVAMTVGSVLLSSKAFAQPTAPVETTTTVSPSGSTTTVEAATPSTPPQQPPSSTPPASSASPSAPSGLQLTTLKLMLAKGMISQAEYDSAMKDLQESTGNIAPDANTVVFGKWATTLYGFVEADYSYDSTQSFNDQASSALVARPDTYKGENGRSQFSIRNSRFGMRMKAPEYHSIRASAQLEMDFLGTQLPITSSTVAGGSTAGTGSEAAFFNNPTFRVRHMNFRLETPIVDVLFGQYWDLMGWQSVYHPNTVEIQGVPGQLYSRTMQLRLSKTVKSEAINFEVAIAAMRPPQRDSALPEGQAGIRLSSDKWTGYHTSGATGSAIQPISIAVTGDLRSITAQEATSTGALGTTNHANQAGSALAVDAYIPIIRATKDDKNGAFGVYGELASGYGTADLYSSLNPGLTNAATQVPGSTPATYAAYTSNFDPGIAVLDNTGGVHLVQWTTYYIGGELYLPGTNGKYWVSGNYSHLSTDNAHAFTGGSGAGAYAKPTGVLSVEDWFDVNLFGDITPAVRLGLEYANFNDQYVDGTHAINHRVQFSGFYIF